VALVISLLAQKGGVGKSTLARLVAREYAANNWTVKIADMDLGQGTAYAWHQRRLQAGTMPVLSVEQFGSVKSALKASEAVDLLVFDGAPAADRQTRQIAEHSDLVVIPSGVALDDLEPTVRLANVLQQHCNHLSLCLSRVGTSTPELNEARGYLGATPHHVLDGHLLEKTGYRRASDAGRTATETNFSTLNSRADFLAQTIIDRLSETASNYEVANG
tara:strand:+ start:2944 stop:3597 length:654 start_codon:yes stop_codon:yes gene_type:complete